MAMFVYEFIFFIVSVFAIVVSISSGTLFFITFRHERLMRNGWRAIGFFCLAIAFFILILERKSAAYGFFGVLLEMIGMLAIYRGVLASPSLIQLAQDPGSMKMTSLSQKEEEKGEAEGRRVTVATLVATAMILFAVLFAVMNTFIVRILAIDVVSTFQGVTFFFILGTIILQIERFLLERTKTKAKLQNLYPLIAYIFLLLREVAVFLFRFPQSDVVFLRKLTIQYSMAWQLGVFFTFAAFIFLGLWAWNFIKHRSFLRTYVIFLVLSVMVAALGALIFTTLVFRIIERNNLDLMARGAETQQILQDDRETLALFVARLVADDDEFRAEMRSGSNEAMSERLDRYMGNAGVDTLRIYNKFGEIIVSPSDPREQGTIANEDPVIAFVIAKKTPLKTFDTQSGVLSPIMVARAVHPIVDGGVLLGAVEVGYKFDNAFVDYSKEATGLDVTIYTGKRRSATTITTLDGVSRWVGSEEVDPQVIDAVLGSGMNYSTMTDRLGRVYYSAYKPIRHIDGRIIGMVSVGTIANKLFEDTRQQLLTIFLLVTVMALLAAMVAYRAVFVLQEGKKKKGQDSKKDKK